jgi:hypothetical protein
MVLGIGYSILVFIGSQRKFYISPNSEKLKPEKISRCQYLIPNPDKPVVAKRKSRFIGELNIED